MALLLLTIINKNPDKSICIHELVEFCCAYEEVSLKLDKLLFSPRCDRLIAKIRQGVQHIPNKD